MFISVCFISICLPKIVGQLKKLFGRGFTHLDDPTFDQKSVKTKKNVGGFVSMCINLSLLTAVFLIINKNN